MDASDRNRRRQAESCSNVRSPAPPPRHPHVHHRPGEQEKQDGEAAGLHGIASWLQSPLVDHSIALPLDENDRRGQVLELIRVAVHLDPEDRTRPRPARPRHLFENAATENPAAVNEPVAAGVGVVGNPELNGGAPTVAWWREHCKQASAELGRRTAEEKHIEVARIALNRSVRAESIRTQVLRSAEDAIRLFVATMIYHDQGKGMFPVERYLLQ